jgi:hypothetical protein
MPATFAINQPGQIQGAGDPFALFLKMFAGEVLATFERSVATGGTYLEKRVTAGKSHQFPALGRAQAKRYTPGDNILDATNGYLSQIKGDERIIMVDSPILSSVILDDWEEALNHFETRQEYVNKLVEELVIAHDTNVLSVGIAAARTNLTFTHPDYVADRSVVGTYEDADSIYNGLMKAAEIFDQNDVPMGERFCFLRPRQYHALMYKFAGGVFTGGALMNNDLVSGGIGAFETARLTKPIAGFQIRMTKNLPSADKSAVDDDIGGTARNDVFGSNGHGYNGDFSDVRGLCIQKKAVGTVSLWNVDTKSEYKIEAQGHLTVCRMSEGHGVLRPEAAVELVTA